MAPALRMEWESKSGAAMTIEDRGVSAIDPVAKIAFAKTMTNKSGMTAPSDRQKVDVNIRFAKNVRIDVRVQMSSGGLLAVGGMVSGILLASAVLVGTSIASARRPFDQAQRDDRKRIAFRSLDDR